MSKVTYEGVDRNAIIDIQVSGYFYQQLVHNLLLLGESQTPEKFKKVLEKMKTNTPANDLFELSVRNLVALVHEIETKAKAQGKAKVAEIDPDAPNNDLT